MKTVVLIASTLVSITSYAKAPDIDPELLNEFKGKIESVAFFADGRMSVFGPAAEEFYNTMKADAQRTAIGNFVKPEINVSMSCAKVKDKRTKNRWIFTCGIGSVSAVKDK